MLLWTSERDFDDSNPPEKRIVFSGHAGLGGLSPLEIRELGGDMGVASKVVNVFGRGQAGQEKVMLKLPTVGDKSALEEAIHNTVFKND